MNKAVKLLVLQAHRMLGIALEHWSDPDSAPEPEVTGLVDSNLVEQERDRDELRRRGVQI
jgi:hypothetical protein